MVAGYQGKDKDCPIISVSLGARREPGVLSWRVSIGWKKHTNLQKIRVKLTASLPLNMEGWKLEGWNCPKSGPICLVFRGGFWLVSGSVFSRMNALQLFQPFFFKDPLEKTKPFPVSLSQHTFHNMNTIQGPTHWWWNQGFGWHCGMKATAWTHIWRASLRRLRKTSTKRRTPEQYFVWSWSKNGLTSWKCFFFEYFMLVRKIMSQSIIWWFFRRWLCRGF